MNFLAEGLTNALSPPSRHRLAGWAMCKLTKTDSAVLSWYLETEYVNEITNRGYALRPNLDVPIPRAKVTR